VSGSGGDNEPMSNSPGQSLKVSYDDSNFGTKSIEVEVADYGTFAGTVPPGRQVRWVLVCVCAENV